MRFVRSFGVVDPCQPWLKSYARTRMHNTSEAFQLCRGGFASSSEQNAHFFQLMWRDRQCAASIWTVFGKSTSREGKRTKDWPVVAELLFQRSGDEKLMHLDELP